MGAEPAWPDWGEFITQDREHINQLRGLRSPQPTQQPTQRMGEPTMETTETELAEMAATPWRDLYAGQQRMVLAHLCGHGRSNARTALRDALNMNPSRTAMELWEIQQAAGAGPSTGGHQPDTDDDDATGAPTTPVRWEPGMLVKKLPEDLHHARVVISDAQKTARAAHEHPGRWVVYGVSDGEHARRIALEKVRRVVRAKTSAFAPAASFEAQAREVEPGRYVVFCRYVGAEQ
ncbi:hypothetical protein PG2048B_1140 [Bifidobacterium pseudolongum subsp. globosum]|uniref:hypothetical protein n=1 Tax=Bifidobacterium pseudolongum TaxID=1694 RepID=UPI00101FC8FF|nr:hypothetical protein [Bifidobacterium pseudolongum]RYQ24838.1 hypothetical protein PG2048B_1140 [Bifidobacterium pseudolongum subsp. globosum]